MSSPEWPPHDSDDRYDAYDDDDFDDDDEPSEYSLEEYEDLARQIRSLSNVIWLTGEHSTLSHHPAPPNIDLRSVYRALATLLTRDSRHETGVAVTGDGSTIVDATQFTALVPYRNELEEPHISPESYTGADYAMLDMTPTEVVPNFGDARFCNPSSDEEHAACLMGILWTLGEQPRALSFVGNEQRQTAFRFVYSQCWTEVRRCAEGANYIPKPTRTWHDMGLLECYVPSPDELSEKTFEIIPPYISSRFTSQGLECWVDSADMMMTEDDESGPLFAFCPMTARVWFSILCDGVYDVLLQCERWRKKHDTPSASDMDGVVNSMTELHLLFELDAMQRLLHFPSLQRYLDLYHPHLNTHIAPMLAPTRNEQRTIDRAESKILEEWREHGNIIGRLRQHIRGLLSWHQALTTLVEAMAYAQHPITLQLVRYRRPSDSWREHLRDHNLRAVLEMDRPLESAKSEDVWRYLVEGLPDTDELSPEQQLILDLEIEERVKVLELPRSEDVPPKSKPRTFEGSVHTEALLMDFLAQGELAYPETIRQHPCLMTFVNHQQVFNKIIGIPLQYDMCYCCSLLEARLLHDERVLFSSVRGPVVPWTPPLLLHKDDVLEALHGALVQLLADIIVTQEKASRTPTPTGNMAE